VAGSPGRARAWNNLGYAYALAGDHERARDAYRRALAIDPSHVKARWNLEALSECRGTHCQSCNGSRNAECGVNYYTDAALWAALAAVSINMWVAFPLQRPVRSLTFWLILGLVAGMLGRKTGSPTSNE
jgi:tetratricopeptide (TPR) repeat protein